jgi:hypothetical protein
MHAESRLPAGADERSRTPDLRITNALLYQLSYIGNPDRLRRATNRRQA